jgi:lysine 2,3-aminomutase
MDFQAVARRGQGNRPRGNIGSARSNGAHRGGAVMALSSTVSSDVESVPETDLSALPLTRGRFNNEKVRRLLHEALGEHEFSRLVDARVDERMMFGINPYYLALAVGGGFRDRSGKFVLPEMPPSRALLALVMPHAAETIDLKGQQDPSSQNLFSPDALKGKIIHKYDEIVLGHTTLACSAHCRYCYRLDLFNRSTGKGLVTPNELRDYIIGYNSQFAKGAPGGSSASESHHPISEVLLSGGDPMVLSNGQLYKYLVAAAEAGVDTIRIGTKEIAFRPHRFDEKFIEMLRIFHKRHPNTWISFMMQFTHPDEFLERNKEGNYLETGNYSTQFTWLEIVEQPLRALSMLDFVGIENQTPMIKRVNDQSYALHILHKELCRKGIKTHYTFQCREIEGYKFFAVPIETAWRIHNASQRGLTALGRSRFVLSTEWGKLEVTGVVDDTPPDAAFRGTNGIEHRIHFEPGIVVFKIHRSPGFGETQGELIIAKSNPEALWISDYEDRILYDGRRRGTQQCGGAPAVELVMR